MVKLKGSNIYLRALEPEDLEFIYAIENDTSFWEVSDTQTPYSRYVIKQYLEHSSKDIYEVKQLRLVICSHSDAPVGLIDIFDFDFKNRRAGVGIVIKEDKNKNKGIGHEALSLLTNYSFNSLQLHQLYANVGSDNPYSLKLFKKNGFTEVGVKKDWRFDGNDFHDVHLLQRIKN